MHIPTNHEVETFTGRFVDTNSPQPSTIALEDIAHALSQTCRFGGHCRSFYSVAEHAVFVSRRLERERMSAAIVMGGLHHDDAEAYLGDIPRPLKPLLGNDYRRLTLLMDSAIAEALALPAVTAEGEYAIKAADTWSLMVEARHLLPSGGRGWLQGPQDAWDLSGLPSRIVVPDYWGRGMNPDAAEHWYLKRHAELTKRLENA